MANVQTINMLVNRVRQRSDQINSTAYDDTSELKPWIRGSLSQLYEILCQRGKDYYTTCRPISLAGGQEAYSLPSDFKKLVDVFLLYNNGANRQILRPFAVDEYGDGGVSSRATMRYRIMRNLLFLNPTPTADAYNAIELHYVPHYRAPLLDYTSIDEVLPDGWEEWIVLDVLQKMGVKTRLQNMDDILKSKAQMEARLIMGASMRDGWAPVMRDAYKFRRLAVGGQPSGPMYWAIP